MSYFHPAGRVLIACFFLLQACGAAAQPKIAVTDRPELALQLGHSMLVFSLAYSPDGSTLASGSGDGTVKIWDANARELIRTIPAHAASVRAVAYSPDGSTLASGSEDGTIKFWDVESGRLRLSIAPRPAIGNASLRGRVYALAYSPDGKTLAAGYGDASGSVPHGELVVFDTRTGATKQTLARNIRQVTSVAFSPDGKTLASAEANRHNPPETDRTLRVWNLQTGAQRLALKSSDTGSSIYALAFSRNGSTLATAGGDKTVRLRRAGDGQLLQTLTGHTAPVLAVVFSPDGKMLASVGWDNQLLLWDAGTGRRVRAIPVKSRTAHALAFSPDGSALAVGLDREIHLFNSQSGADLGNFEARPLYVRQLAYSTDGKTLAVAGGLEEPICLWDAQTGRLRKTLESNGVSFKTLAISRDGAWLAATGIRKTTAESDEIFLWNARTGVLARRLEGHKTSIDALRFSPDGRTLASGSRTVNGASSKGEIKLWNPQNGQLLRSMHGQNGRISDLAYSPDGKLLASGNAEGKDKGVVEIWNPQTGQKLRVISGGQGWVQSVAFAGDGSTLAAAGRDGQVRLWNARTGAFLKSLAHGNWVRSVAFSPDGSTLASGGKDNLIRTWDTKTGRLLRVLRGHEYGVETLAFSPDGSTLASGSIDTTVRLWHTRDWRQLAFLLTSPAEQSERHLNVGRLWLTATPEGYYDCAEGTDYLVKWRFNRRLLPFYHFEETYRRPDLLQRALRGESIAARPLLITRVPPVIRLLALANVPGEPGKIRALIQAADDNILPNENFEFYVNGVRIPDQVAKPIVVDGKPIVVDGKPIVVDGKPIVVDGKPIVVDGKPIVVDGKPIVVDGKPVAATGETGPRAQEVRAEDGWAPSVTASGGNTLAEYAFHRLYVMDFPLPQQEEIVLRAVITDDEGNKSDDGLTMQRPQIEPRKGNLYVLAIGISSYRNPLYNISYAASDAHTIAATLQAQQGRQYAKVQTTVLSDRQATVANIRSALSTLQAAGPDDTVMVFLSGHGIAAGDKTYFAPWGVFVHNLTETCIEWSEIVERLSSLYAKKLLFTDACHSGAKLGNWQATNAHLAEAVRRVPGIVLFASSQADEFSFEDKELKQGTFSRALAEGFSGRADINRDGNITLPELAMYVPERVSRSTRGLQNPQLVLVKDFNPQTVLTKAD